MATYIEISGAFEHGLSLLDNVRLLILEVSETDCVIRAGHCVLPRNQHGVRLEDTHTLELGICCAHPRQFANGQESSLLENTHTEWRSRTNAASKHDALYCNHPQQPQNQRWRAGRRFGHSVKFKCLQGVRIGS